MKKAIQFGAGNIGRGFIGGLLSKAGYHVVFADVNQEIIDKINEDKKYTIFVKDVESSEIVITDISGVNSTKPELIDEVKEAEIITTAVGVRILPIIAPSIAEGIKARKENGSEEYLNIIACFDSFCDRWSDDRKNSYSNGCCDDLSLFYFIDQFRFC